MKSKMWFFKKEQGKEVREVKFGELKKEEKFMVVYQIASGLVGSIVIAQTAAKYIGKGINALTKSKNKA